MCFLLRNQLIAASSHNCHIQDRIKRQASTPQYWNVQAQKYVCSFAPRDNLQPSREHALLVFSLAAKPWWPEGPGDECVTLCAPRQGISAREDEKPLEELSSINIYLLTRTGILTVHDTWETYSTLSPAVMRSCNVSLSQLIDTLLFTLSTLANTGRVHHDAGETQAWMNFGINQRVWIMVFLNGKL